MIYFQTLVIQQIIAPFFQSHQLKTVFKNNYIEITSPLWNKHLTLFFIQQDKYHFDVGFSYREIRNGEIIWDMPINIDTEIRKNKFGFYDYFEHFAFIEGKTQLFTTPEKLLETQLFQPMIEALKAGLPLKPLKVEIFESGSVFVNFTR